MRIVQGIAVGAIVLILDLANDRWGDGSVLATAGYIVTAALLSGVAVAVVNKVIASRERRDGAFEPFDPTRDH